MSSRSHVLRSRDLVTSTRQRVGPAKFASVLMSLEHPCLPVLAIQAHPSHPHLLITSLYDGTIQELYFKRQQSTEIANCQVLFPADAILFSAFDFANHGRELWASDTAGGLVHCNLCQPKSSARCWTASKKKIGCLSICPHFGDRLAVTAGLNQEMR
ncbi:hypothetical protein PtB15_14B245 [Puccinia triticina]|nr:hypothetical protein PtB15_14B245 [Puccinia triticina]